MFGVIVNVIAVIIGTILGLAIGSLFTEKLRTIAFQAIGLAVMVSGLTMTLSGLEDLAASNLKSFSLVVYTASLIVGALIGEALNIEGALARLGDAINSLMRRFTGGSQKALVHHDEGASEKTAAQRFAQGFADASILFVVGAMSIIGSIQAGLGDYNLLLLKSVLDGVTAIILASTLGIGVAFSGISLLVFQGALALGAQSLQAVFTVPVMASISAIGGTIIIAIGFNFLGIKKINVGNFLPALIIAALIAGFLG